MDTICGLNYNGGGAIDVDFELGRQMKNNFFYLEEC